MNYGQSENIASAMLGASNAPNGTSISQSDSILSRLNGLRNGLQEVCAAAGNAADKIVGAAPTPLQPNGSVSKQAERPPAQNFLEAINQAINDLERVGAETHEHLSRLNRAF